MLHLLKATHFCKKCVYIVVRMQIVRNCWVSLGLNMAIWQEVAGAGCGVSFRGVSSYRSASVRNARPAKRRWRRGMDAESDVILVRQLSKLCDVTARAAHTVRVHTTHGSGQPLVQYVRVVRSRAVVIVAFVRGPVHCVPTPRLPRGRWGWGRRRGSGRLEFARRGIDRIPYCSTASMFINSRLHPFVPSCFWYVCPITNDLDSWAWMLRSHRLPSQDSVQVCMH